MSRDTMTDISVKQIRAYLRDHPTFLDENPDILETMIVQHKTDGAVSLVERQLSILRERNNKMSLQLDSLVDLAQENELMFIRTRKLIISLLDSKSFKSLVDTLYKSLSDDFNIQSFTLTLFVDDSFKGASKARVCSLETVSPQFQSIVNADRSVCGMISAEEAEFLFGNTEIPVGSVATSVIYGNGKLGIISLGNSDNDFYQSDMGTLFLDYIADVLGRLLTKYITK